MLDYWRLCDATVDTAAERLDLNASQSGFSWHGTMTKLDHQVHNIPHIPHHATMLSARLRLANGMQVRWVQTNGESYGA